MSEAEGCTIKMAVAGISVDPDNSAAILVLAGDQGEQLVIAIGLAEATAIATELEKVQIPRPLTHDLMRNVLEALDARLLHVEVVDLRDNTFFAELVLQDVQGQEFRVDSRPSDAIALAVRTKSPIIVHEQVLEKAQPQPEGTPPTTDKEAWKKLLEEMDPEDFGKYKM